MDINQIISNSNVMLQSNSVLNAQKKLNELADEGFESMLTAALNEQDDKKLKDACVQFEELMLGMLYKQMKATIIRADESEKDSARDTYEQWQDDAMVKEMAKNGSFGLANMMYKQLSKRMENEYVLNDD